MTILDEKLATSAVLHADETGWRKNGATHWLWCFTTKKLCYYIITRNRGSPVIKKFLGILFKGILICDFWGAYNKISALAKQRCFYHLFTELVKAGHYNQSNQWKVFRKKLSLAQGCPPVVREKEPCKSKHASSDSKRDYIVGLNSF